MADHSKYIRGRSSWDNLAIDHKNRKKKSRDEHSVESSRDVLWREFCRRLRSNAGAAFHPGEARNPGVGQPLRDKFGLAAGGGAATPGGRGVRRDGGPPFFVRIFRRLEGALVHHEFFPSWF